MEELSPRESEVFELVGRHLSNPQIAEQLYISVRTVESHVATLIRKLELPDRRSLVAYAEGSLPQLRTERARTNLPVTRSSFIGRGRERERLREIVKAEALVTLTGIAGCGKTRLALAVASDLAGGFDDGTFFVDFSKVSDPTLVAPAVAGALSLQMVDPTPNALADYFATRQTLLLFDNCEHLLDACSEVADALFGERCPGLRILATSREPFGLDGEHVFQVPSLDIADEAVVLFVDRALIARPILSIDPKNEATIAEICLRLDGIPLAIEMAASRAAHMSPTEILGRLNDRFGLLVGGRRRIPRQQTLSAALDWSYDLLGPDEQLLLRRLGVFRGSFSLSAAEAICHSKAMDLLGSLVSKSLVSVSDHDEVVRYRLLESVRIYAEQKLAETGESEQLRSAHRDFYLEWIESLPMGHNIGGIGYLLAPEADNLTAALETSRQQGRYDLFARIALRMTDYWVSFFQLTEMMAWWRELDAGLPAEDHEHRVLADLVRGQAAFVAGQWEELNEYSARVSALADPHTWVGLGALYLQATYWSMVDPPRGDRLFEQAFAIETSNGTSPNPVAFELLNTSRLLRATGRDEALVLLGNWLADLGDSTPPSRMVGMFALYGDIRTALELKSRTPPPRTPAGRSPVELSDALLASAQGHFEEAEQHLATMAAVARDFAITRWEVTCLLGFTKVAIDRGDYARASRLLSTVETSTRPIDGPRRPMDALIYDHCARSLREVLDPERARSTQVTSNALSLKEALDAELIRKRSTGMVEQVD